MSILPSLLLGMNGPPEEVRVARVPPERTLTDGVLRAGAAWVDVTPGFLTPVAGWSLSGRKMRAMWGRLAARVLVLDDGQGERVALIAADLHAGSRYVSEKLAARTASLGLHIGRLFLAGTHTHSGPGGFYGAPFYDSFAQAEPGVDARWVDYLVEQLERGVREACQRLRPARVGHGLARQWGYSRNRSLEAARNNFPALNNAAFRQEAEALGYPDGTPPAVPSELPLEQVSVDPRVQVLWADEAAPPHRPIGAFATFGVHAALLSLTHSLGSPDLFGVAASHAEHLMRAAEPGSEPVLGLAAGAIGDTDPVVPGLSLEALKRERHGRTRNLELTTRVGHALGRCLFEACGEARARAETSVRLSVHFDEPWIRDATLSDGTKLPPEAEVGIPTLGGSEMGGGFPLLFCEGTRGKQHRSDPQSPKETPGLLEDLLHELLEHQPPTLPLRLLKVGGVWLMGLPGEPTSWLSHRLGRELRQQGAREVMVAGVCGDYMGYLTTEREYERQHYEGSSTLWGRHTESWLVEQSQRLAKSAPGRIPSGEAHFPVRWGKHLELSEPAPPLGDGPPDWPRPPRFEEPRLLRGGLLLRGSWFGWAPQEERELGRAPWVQLEDAATGEVLRSGGLPVDDQHQRFLLEFSDDDELIEWKWSVVLDDWRHWEGLRVRFRPMGPRGVRVQPPPGGQWPEHLMVGDPPEH
jgi:neutral ceramidase